MAIATEQLVERIWERDPTVWTGSGEEKWLGWLDEPQRMRERIDDLQRFVEDLAAPGVIDTFVLLGMGGSSLAPLVLKKSFGERSLHVLDTTHPALIRHSLERLDLDKTLFIASSKSGTTLARERGFLEVFAGEPTIGGRYSALSPFGMVPAALLGIDLERLLERTAEMVEACRLADGNPGLELGQQLSEGWRAGRDKVCIDETEGGFGLWG